MSKVTEDFIVDEKHLHKLFNFRPSAIDISKSALENSIIPYKNFEPISFDKDMWDTFKKETYGNTYQLYIQSLRVCANLLVAYERSKNQDYFDKAQEIINSWIEYQSNNPDNDLLWYDHPTSNRTQILTHYIYIAERIGKLEDKKQILNILEKHAHVLKDDDNYSHNNHGIMIDRALLVLGKVLKNEDYINLAKKRLNSIFWKSFSDKGIHLENSPEYHFMVVNLFKRIEQYLNKSSDTLGQEIKEHLLIARKYMNNIITPDKSLPLIGDTEYRNQTMVKTYSNIFDPVSGISVLQDDSLTHSYLSLVCGYTSKTHKHQDDLSITLYYEGNLFITDSGKYNYNKDMIREYIVSKEAHSTVFPKELDYKLNSNGQSKSRLLFYNENTDYIHVCGKTQEYDSLEIERHIIKFKSRFLIVIVDLLQNPEEHLCVQRFQLPSDVTPQIDENKVQLKNSNTSIFFEFFNNPVLSVKKSSKSPPLAIHSSVFNQIEGGSVLDAEHTDSFVTVIHNNECEIDCRLFEGSLVINLEKKYIIDL